jgi:dTDP-4-amino-4,6-dideoxygalactose transaminase
MNNKPAILGGEPLFGETLPIVRPNAAGYWDTPELRSLLDEIFRTNRLSGAGSNVINFERAFAKLVDAKHAVALSSCTAGLMLAIQALGAADKEIILPSFTFSATAHAAAWNRCRLVFADIDDTLCIDPDDVERKITGKTALILAVHMYGLPCDVERLEEISGRRGIPVLYDAAHAAGAAAGGRGVGAYGAAAVFSFSPTKLITTVEGGMLTTNDEAFAEKMKLDRNYSNKPDYQCERAGLSARMGEPAAAFGLQQIADLPGFIKNRASYSAEYKKRLQDTPGLAYQRIPESRASTHKDFSVFVDADKFGMDRDMLAKALDAENIMTRRYFYPPIHMLKPHRKYAAGPLPVTEEKTTRVLSLPVYNIMEAGDIERAALAVRRAHLHADEVRERLALRD